MQLSCEATSHVQTPDSIHMVDIQRHFFYYGPCLLDGYIQRVNLFTFAVLKKLYIEDGSHRYLEE